MNEKASISTPRLRAACHRPQRRCWAEAEPMKKCLPVFLALAFCSMSLQAKNQSKASDFSGNWVLDFSQTKNPPPGLQNYSMVVNQAQQRLKVETSIQGDVQPAAGQNGPYPGGSYPGG